MRKSQALLLPLPTDGRLGMGEAGSESYSSNSSFSDSYSDSSDLANWEEFVGDDGSLFYAEYLPQLRKPTSSTSTSTSTSTTGASGSDQHQRIEFTRSSSLRMGKKLARRQQQQQQSKANGHQSQQQQQQQRLTRDDERCFRFADIKSHDNPKQLALVITAADRFRFGRRSTAVESILGFRVVPFADQLECLMVDGFVHDMPAMQQQQRPIQRGDWFKSLDDIEVRASNVDELLLQFVEPTQVCLKFVGAVVADEAAANGAAGGAATSGAPGELKKIEDFAMFATNFEKLLLLQPAPMSATMSATTTTTTTTTPPSADANPTEAAQTPAACGDTPFPFGLLILPPECYQSDEHRDSLYFYPEQATTNFLYKARGSFLTLNAVLSTELQTRPLTSRLVVGDAPYYVSYSALNGFLVLFAFAAAHHTLAECGLRADELIAYMRFTFPRLSINDFSNTNAASTALRSFLRHFCEVQRVRLLVASQRRQPPAAQFEELLRESRHMPLPKEAQLRMFDALSEMEAMDYRNWNDDPLNTHREFFIHGSVLYYDCYMLASQMPVEVRASVEGFLRCRGIFDFLAAHSVKELYVWEEIVLPNASGRYFLTVCSRSHLVLAVILKIFDAPDLPADATVPPSLFYIEEIQETLDHLIQCGIESLAMFWSISNKRPETLDKIEPPDADASTVDKDTRRLDTFIRQKLSSSVASAAAASSSSSAAATTTASGSQATQRGGGGGAGAAYDEDAHLCSSLGGSSIHSLTPSEDDSSKKRLTAPDADSDSGSDWDNFAEQNPLHASLDSEAQAQMTESLWKEINNVVPVKISAGWKNAVFYYVYVDSANGSVFCPLKANSDAFPFLQEMRIACHQIHKVLQRTKNFRRLLALESSKPTNAKGMLAIKEHGITMQVREAGDKGVDGAIKGRFVVVGRLFYSPTKEVYVCHRPDVPQNMVEMAFRLSFFSVG